VREIIRAYRQNPLLFSSFLLALLPLEGFQKKLAESAAGDQPMT
jgi:hypothetical protein